jgi:calcineurin-like phosphoesterase family protein
MSSKVFFISDTHFGHTNMALKRGFSSSAEMDEHIVEQWNSVVRKSDVVYLLGDISMEKSNYEILDRLKGFKKVILGNHDMPQHVTKLLNHVNSVCGMYKYKNFILSHAPIHECEIKRFQKNIHGHVHENSVPDARYINVSCEVVDYTPRTLDELMNVKID